MGDDIWSQKTEYFDDGVKFGTGPEMIAQIKALTRQLDRSKRKSNA